MKAQNKSKWSIDCKLYEGKDLCFILLNIKHSDWHEVDAQSVFSGLMNEMQQLFNARPRKEEIKVTYFMPQFANSANK